MMIERQINPEFVNQLINHPEVRPYVDDTEGYIDVSSQIVNKDNYFLTGEFGGVAYIKIFPYIYEVHSFFLPEGRGQWGKFTRTDAYELTTRIPNSHVAAKKAALSAGFQFYMSHEKACKFEGNIDDIDVYNITLSNWIIGSEHLENLGRVIHEMMHDAAEKLHIDTPPHGDLISHNKFVGAAYLMVCAGQIKKGVAVYNRFAMMARHRTIALVSENPPVIRFDIGLLHIKPGGELEVVREN
jgi:hypothetical protein